MNTYLFLRDQRQRRKRSNMHQLRKLAESAKRLAKAELTTQASERANEITEQEFFGLKEKSSPKGSQKMSAYPEWLPALWNSRRCEHCKA
jgi:hypothetical protein